MNIAVRGIGIISALGNGAGETLAALRAGRSGIGKPTLFRSAVDVPVGEVRRDNRALGELLGIPARETPSRTALLGMIAAAQAVADAAIPAAARVALVSGTSVGGMDLTENFYRDFRSDNGRGRLRSVAGHDCADSTRRIAEYCGITGYTATVSTACSSAANAVITGALLLENDMADYVVAGGTDALCRFTLNGFNTLSILDRERCRPFDATRAGLNLGEGAGYVVLAREEPGMRSYCRLAGYANANDAHHQTASSETGEGAYRAMAEALARRAVETGATRHPELVALSLAAGLLHDIAKSYTVQFGGSHAQIGASWVVDSTGNHKVAQAVYHHVEWPWPLPEDLVHPVFFVIYADKRARHDEMVSLDERYEDLLVRYGKSEHSRAAIHRGWEHSKTIERVLSAQLEFPLHESTVVGGRLVSRA